MNGRRVQKLKGNARYDEEASAQFLHDGWNLVAELNRNDTDGLYNLCLTCAWGPDLSGSLQGAGGVGGLAVIKSGSTVWLFPGYDGNGNLTCFGHSNDASGLMRHEYDPYGNVLSRSGPWMVLDSPFRFSTKYLDGSGLLYFGYRYYNPETGRWINRDPIEDMTLVNTSTGSQRFTLPNNKLLNLNTVGRSGNAGAVNSFNFSTWDVSNLYRYVQNNPTNLVDLLGLMVDPTKDCGITENRNPLLKPKFWHWWLYDSNRSTGWDFMPASANVVPFDCQFFSPCAGKTSSGNGASANQRSLGLVPWNRLQKGPAGIQGKKCKCASCSDITACLDQVAKDWNNTRYIWWFKDCVNFVREAKTSCCMFSNNEPPPPPPVPWPPGPSPWPPIPGPAF